MAATVACLVERYGKRQAGMDEGAGVVDGGSPSRGGRGG